MNNNPDSNKSFSEWATECYDQNPEIVEHWNKGADPFKRAMAIMILDVAEDLEGGIRNE
jgi:hypothetical protein